MALSQAARVVVAAKEATMTMVSRRLKTTSSKRNFSLKPVSSLTKNESRRLSMQVLTSQAVTQMRLDKMEVQRTI